MYGPDTRCGARLTSSERLGGHHAEPPALVRQTAALRVPHNERRTARIKPCHDNPIHAQ